MRAMLMMLCILPLLGGCKSELYTQLNEAEANQMLALLIYNRISADKSVEKNGVTIRVDEDRFVDAVEVLRQNGLPRQRTVTMQDLFPSGQLVSSPEEEEAKLNYLKSQQLEKMLGSVDGVITAEVSVAKPKSLDGESAPPSSAAVFIKYSPEVNLLAREGEIRALIHHGIPGLTPELISLTMQRAEFRYQPPAIYQETPNGLTLYGQTIPWQALGAAAASTLIGVIATLAIWLRRRTWRGA